MYINDWYNENDIIIDLEGNTFDGWHYNGDYTKIYVDTLEGQTYKYDCINDCQC